MFLILILIFFETRVNPVRSSDRAFICFWTKGEAAYRLCPLFNKALDKTSNGVNPVRSLPKNNYKLMCEKYCFSFLKVISLQKKFF